MTTILARDPEHTETAAPAAPQGRVLLVRCGRMLFGLPLTRCTEVLTSPGYTPLPGSEAFVRGLINLRGRLVTVLDLGVWAGQVGAEEEHSVVILQHGARAVGLAVEEVVRIVEDGSAEPDRGADASPAVLLRRSLPDAEDHEEHVFGLLNPDAVFRPVLV